MGRFVSETEIEGARDCAAVIRRELNRGRCTVMLVSPHTLFVANLRVLDAEW
jgi:hypothetical protein